MDRLSTPFWEFHTRMTSLGFCSTFLRTLSTPFWEFQGNGDCNAERSKSCVTFYSLLGVSDQNTKQLLKEMWKEYIIFLLPFGSFLQGSSIRY